jgi:uncharacterized membrane protein
MLESIYPSLNKLGYTHPLHPALTHLPIGLIMGGFIFCLLALVLKRYALFQASRYCLILTLCALPFTLVAGFADWQQYYDGKWLVPITMKLIFAGLLLIMVGYAIRISFRQENAIGKTLFLYAIGTILVVALGYFGGDLVYGTQKVPADTTGSQVDGASLFQSNCALCHSIDGEISKSGPSLKGLFALEKLPVSGEPVTPENVVKQLKTPFKNMPSFDQLTEEEIRAIIDYLKTV